jgi:hypothetical protein
MKIRKFLKQKAVYWGAPVPDGFGGHTYADPIEIPCRWTDKQELFVNYAGDQVLSKAKLMVDQDLVVKGMVALMQLVDLSSTQLPADNNAFEIRAFQKMPDVRAKMYVRQAWL